MKANRHLIPNIPLWWYYFTHWWNIWDSVSSLISDDLIRTGAHSLMSVFVLPGLIEDESSFFLLNSEDQKLIFHLKIKHLKARQPWTISNGFKPADAAFYSAVWCGEDGKCKAGFSQRFLVNEEHKQSGSRPAGLMWGEQSSCCRSSARLS